VNITIDIVLNFYDYFYNHFYKTIERLNKTPTNTKHAQSFLDILKKEYGSSIDKNFLYTYFLFQFNYWDGVEFAGTNNYNKGIQLSFIIGKKSFERWTKRNKEYDWQLDSLPIIRKYGLHKEDLVKIGQLSTKHKIAVKKGVDTEAAIKLPFYNTDEGYRVCGDLSTLYNHKSSICEGCIYKIDCKKRLQQNYPTLYMDRGYK
jgi:hypothetical protein